LPELIWQVRSQNCTCANAEGEFVNVAPDLAQHSTVFADFHHK